ncbi:hypothetical protein GUJ93_ZPchr0013g35382 [Zizania palustris]|uniref:Uncharacterized protein n=1 Tax=Zizania palustris TaxID=103762 RepID=A0A8J5X1G7_ZIZPA|nr:hypothetical protein GUJ93_ZPchr0013g35382 [Zizania palustris]
MQTKAISPMAPFPPCLTCRQCRQINGVRRVEDTSVPVATRRLPIRGGAIRMKAAAGSPGHVVLLHWPPTYPVR